MGGNFPPSYSERCGWGKGGCLALVGLMGVNRTINNQEKLRETIGEGCGGKGRERVALLQSTDYEQGTEPFLHSRPASAVTVILSIVYCTVPKGVSS